MAFASMVGTGLGNALGWEAKENSASPSWPNALFSYVLGEDAP